MNTTNTKSDSKSVDEIITRHEPLIRHLALTFTTDDDVLEDLIQVGRVVLWESMATHDSARAALWTYAHNRIRGAMRATMRKVHPRAELSWNEEDLANFAATLAGPLDALEAARADAENPIASLTKIDPVDAAQRLLATLDSIERRIAALHVEQKASFSEIAEMLGMAKSTVAYVYQKAVKAMRDAAPAVALATGETRRAA